MITGKIKATFDRGFAFIIGDDGESYFMHSTDAESQATFAALARGDTVEFEAVVPRPAKGARARNVRYPEMKEVI